MIVKRMQYVREWLRRSECTKLLDYAGLFLFLFCISHLLGMREHTGFISGTSAADKLKLFYGVMYVVTYTASVVFVPILLIASVLLELKCRLCKGRELT